MTHETETPIISEEAARAVGAENQGPGVPMECEGVPAPPAPAKVWSQRQLSLLGVGTAVCCVAGLAWLISSGEAAREREQTLMLDQVRREVEAAALAAGADPEPCEAVRALQAFSPSHADGRRSEVRAVVDDGLATTRAERLTACCNWRLDQIRNGLTHLDAAAATQGETRSGLIAALGTVHEMAEDRMPTLSRCGGDAVLDQLAAAVLIERATEEDIDSAWAAYPRLLEADTAGRRDIADLIFPLERRRDLAARCVREGPAAAERASRAGDHDESLAMYADINDCLETPPDGLVFTPGDRARVSRGLAGATGRAEAASAAAERAAAAEARTAAAEARAGRGREDRAADACFRRCVRGGSNGLDCSAACHREHPGAYQPEYAYDYEF